MNLVHKISLGALAAFMVGVGIMHFVTPQFFVDIVPAALPAPLTLVYISGGFEILGGIGLLVPQTRRFAAYGLITLFIAVFPANINMAINHIQPSGAPEMPAWMAWARLPLQLGLIWWAYHLANLQRTRSID